MPSAAMKRPAAAPLKRPAAAAPLKRPSAAASLERSAEKRAFIARHNAHVGLQSSTVATQPGKSIPTTPTDKQPGLQSAAPTTPLLQQTPIAATPWASLSAIALSRLTKCDGCPHYMMPEEAQCFQGRLKNWSWCGNCMSNWRAERGFAQHV